MSARKLVASFPLSLEHKPGYGGTQSRGVLVYKIAKRFKRNPQIPPGSMSRFHNPRMPSSRLSAPGSFALLKTAYRIEPKGRALEDMGEPATRIAPFWGKFAPCAF